MFTIVSTPDRFPHACHCCNAGAGREWYVDFGDDEISSEIPVTIYVCNLCLVAAAAVKGVVPREQLDEEIDELKVQLFDAQVKADGLEQMIDGALRARFIVPDDITSTELVPAQQRQESVEAGSEGGEGSLHNGQEHMEAGEGISLEPSDVQDVGAIPGGITVHGGTE